MDHAKLLKKAAKLRVLDPACGSGSFLLGAYDFLLKWHRDHYLADGPEKHRKELFQTMGGEWRLTNAERKRILLNNIYGVDIDRQAVEVTKLSLLLKVLEGESKDSMDARSRLFHHERVLPDLSRNIKCGNSLIGPDFYDGQQLSMFDDEERYRINVFDWHAAFPEIMKSGGFDAVIGNPPYIRIQNLQESAPLEVEHYKESYHVAAKGNYDIYVVFVERGLQLLAHNGCLGFILPHKFFTAQYGESLRSLLAKGRHVRQVTHFGDKQVFENATTYTCLLFLAKTASKEVTVCKVDDLDVWRQEGTSSDQTISAKSLGTSNWLFGEGKQSALLERLRGMPITLGKIADRIAQGIRTSANEIYVLDVVRRESGIIRAFSKSLDDEVAIEEEIALSFLRGREIKAHRITPSGKVVLVPYRLKEQRATLISESEMKCSFPRAFAYLQRNRSELEQREDGRMRGANWYAYVYPKNLEVMQSPKIVVPDIGDRAAFAIDIQGRFAFTSGYAITLKPFVPERAAFIVGLLNSSLLEFFIRHVSTPLRGGFFRYFTQYLEQMPICRLDLANEGDKSRHDRMVALVEQMLDLHPRLAKAKSPHDRSALEAQIAATDRQIDRLVYELYGLTDAEIRIVEEATGG